MTDSAITIGLVICIFLLITIIVFIVISYERNKKKLKDSGSRIGLSYKSDDKEIQEIFKKLNHVISSIQADGCASLSDSDMEKQIKDMFNELQSTFETGSCKEAKEAVEKLPSLSEEISPKTIQQVKELLFLVIDSSCKDNKVNIEKVTALIKGIKNALCPK